MCKDHKIDSRMTENNFSNLFRLEENHSNAINYADVTRHIHIDRVTEKCSIMGEMHYYYKNPRHDRNAITFNHLGR